LTREDSGWSEQTYRVVTIDENGIRQRLAFSTINRGEDDLDEGPLPDGRERRQRTT
jgi:hypothetical protein